MHWRLIRGTVIVTSEFTVQHTVIVSYSTCLSNIRFHAIKWLIKHHAMKTYSGVTVARTRDQCEVCTLTVLFTGKEPHYSWTGGCVGNLRQSTHWQRENSCWESNSSCLVCSLVTFQAYLIK
jgi:hypothetical protein